MNDSPKFLRHEDTLKVTDHKMKNCIIAAIQEMQYGTTKDVYRMALKNIEKNMHVQELQHCILFNTGGRKRRGV